MDNSQNMATFCLEPEPVYEVQQLVSKKACQDFNQKAIADDLVNQICLKLLNDQDRISDVSQWVQQKYRQTVEQYFTNLHAYCFHYALKLAVNPETAEDISQDCIRELLCAKTDIGNIKAWLCRVAHNKAASHAKQGSKDSKLSKELALRSDDPPLNPDNEELPNQLSPQRIKKLLSRSDYQMFMELNKFASLKDYAAHKQISYQTAKEHKHRIKINLRSAYLREQGWQDSPDILSFQQLTAIKRFLHKMVTTFATSDAPEKTKNNLFISPESVREAFSGTSGILQWNISALENMVFTLTITAKTDAEPAFIHMNIKLNRANRIGILSCKRGLLLATLPSGDTRMLTKHKGKDQLNYQEFLNLLPQATILEPELFAELLEKWKTEKDSST